MDQAKLIARRNTLSARQGGKCFYCELPLTENGLRFPTLDHIKPLSAGGSNEIKNFVVACNPCNQQKGNMSANAFLAKMSDQREQAESLSQMLRRQTAEIGSNKPPQA